MPYSGPHAIDTRLAGGVGTVIATSFPSDCGGNYTVYFPSFFKEVTGSWWSTSNSTGKIFRGHAMIDLSMTILHKYCLDFSALGGNCECIGPVTINIPISLYKKEVAKPSSPANLDDAPASTSSTHLDQYQLSAYHFYNNVLAGNNSHASEDPNLHGLVNVVTALDLHDPNNNYAPLDHLGSAFSLGIHYTHRDPSGNLVGQSDKRFGFPHLDYPSTHYNITPFDGLYAIGENNGSYNGIPKPDNQFHVENPQNFIGDFLARIEVAPEDLFLSNRTIGANETNYTTEFEARNSIHAGKNNYNDPSRPIYTANQFDNFITPEGDFIVKPTCKAIFHAGQEIALHPGFSIESGANFDAFIQPYLWSNSLFRYSHNPPFTASGSKWQSESGDATLNLSPENEFLVFPNPSKGVIYFKGIKNNSMDLEIIDLSGRKLVYGKVKEDNEFDLDYLPDGVYFIHLRSGTESRFKKLILSR